MSNVKIDSETVEKAFFEHSFHSQILIFSVAASLIDGKALNFIGIFRLPNLLAAVIFVLLFLLLPMRQIPSYHNPFQL